MTAGTGQANRSAEPTFDHLGFLVKDYELKVNYLTNHLTRLWGRFGMFVTLESALVAVLIVQGKVSDQAPRVAVAQAVLSALWFALGRHDRHLIRIYKAQVTDAAQAMPLGEGYVPVSDVTKTNETIKTEVKGLGRLLEGRTVNDVPLLPVVVPGLTLLLWIGLGLALFDLPPFG